MDPNNPVVRLCSEGMRAESEGRPDDARTAFTRAWEAATDDYDACVAAHYVARHQATAEQTLRWNAECLARADRVGDARVRGFYPSLHLNLGRAQLDLGDTERAREHFRQAAERIGDAGDGPYGDWTRYAAAQGLRATGAHPAGDVDAAVTPLMDAMCARGDLRGLALLLPAQMGDLGTPDDLDRLRTVLHMLHASPDVPAGEQTAITTALRTLPAHP